MISESQKASLQMRALRKLDANAAQHGGDMEAPPERSATDGKLAGEHKLARHNELWAGELMWRRILNSLTKDIIFLTLETITLSALTGRAIGALGGDVGTAIGVYAALAQIWLVYLTANILAENGSCT
jgi:hypothetical protein